MNKRLTGIFLALFGLIGMSQAEEPAFRCDFSNGDELEQNWRFQGGIFGVRRTSFSVEQEESARNGRVLVVESNRASGAMASMPKVNLKKTPYLHWRWRVVRPITLQPGSKEPDDQVAVVYVGDGETIKKRAVAYRWEVRSPIGRHGAIRYGMGILSVRYACIRNQETPCGMWVDEERNVYQDFLDAFHTPPNEVFALSVGANSQRAKCSTRVEIDFFEFNEKPVLSATADAQALFR